MKVNQLIKNFGLGKAYELIEFFNKCGSLTSDCDFTIDELRYVVKNHELIESLNGLDEAKSILKDNTLNASYYQPHSRCYYRYSSYGISIVENGKYVEVHGGMDSSTLVHVESIQEAIICVWLCQ